MADVELDDAENEAIQSINALKLSAQTVDDSTLKQQIAAANSTLADAQNANYALQAKYDLLLKSVQDAIGSAPQPSQLQSLASQAEVSQAQPEEDEHQ